MGPLLLELATGVGEGAKVIDVLRNVWKESSVLILLYGYESWAFTDKKKGRGGFRKE